MNDGDRADAGAADGAGADRAHPQGRAEREVRQHARRRARGAASAEILLEGLAPDGGLYLPERYPQRRRRHARSAGAACRIADLAFEILSLLHRRHPGRRPARARATHLHRARSSAATRIVPLRPLEPGLYLQACRTARRWRSRTWRCSCSATLFEYELARRGEHARTSSARPRATPAAPPSTRCAASAASRSSCSRRTAA